MVSLSSLVTGIALGFVGWVWILAVAYVYFHAVDALKRKGTPDTFRTTHVLQIGFLVVSLLGLVVLSAFVVRTWLPTPLWFAIGIGAASVTATALFIGYIVRTNERGIGRAAAIGVALAVGIVATFGMVSAAMILSAITS